MTEEVDESPISQLTSEEQAELSKWASALSPSPEEKTNIHTFLKLVAESDDTTKTGYLTQEEIGNPKLPVRTYKELAYFCNNIGNLPYFADYFNAMSEFTTSTSLSKDAKLLELAVSSVRQIQSITKKSKKPNKGWFGKSKKNDDE